MESKLKLEVGKIYNNKHGQKIKIVAYDEKSNYPFMGFNMERRTIQTYKKNGIWNASDTCNLLNLVKEFKEQSESNQYIFSFFAKRATLNPHKIWWRRLLGQKQIAFVWERHSINFEAPKEIAEDGQGWFQKNLINISKSFSGYYEQLEEGNFPTNCITTVAKSNFDGESTPGLILENQRTNLLTFPKRRFNAEY